MSSPTPTPKTTVKVKPASPPKIVLPTQKSVVAQSVKDHIMLFYGPPGVGKSTFVNDLSPKVLFISTDRGTRSLDTMRVEVTSIQEALDTLDLLSARAKAGTLDYDFICIDHIDDICRMVADEVCSILGIDALGDAGYGKGWKMYSDGIYEVVSQLKALKTGIVFICHETIKTIRANGIETERTMPDMSKSAWKMFVPLVDIIGFCGFARVKQGDKMVEVRTLATSTSNDIYAKDRTRRTRVKGIELLDGGKFASSFQKG